jgi:hypothetical protein
MWRVGRSRGTVEVGEGGGVGDPRAKLFIERRELLRREEFFPGEFTELVLKFRVTGVARLSTREGITVQIQRCRDISLVLSGWVGCSGGQWSSTACGIATGLGLVAV